MRVLVPYVRLSNATVAALHRDGVVPRFVDTSASASGYWQTLTDEWSRGEAFIVLEQDKVPSAGLLQELWECRAPWCVVNAAMRGTDERAPFPSLSCVKFAGEMVRSEADLMRDVGSLDLGFGEREWSRLDMAVAGLLESRGWAPHWHEGVVEHLHEDVAA